MSQSNDVARCRHLRCYLSRNVPAAAKCEADHDMAAAEGIPIVRRRTGPAQAFRKQRMAPGCRDGLGTTKEKHHGSIQSGDRITLHSPVAALRRADLE